MMIPRISKEDANKQFLAESTKKKLKKVWNIPYNKGSDTLLPGKVEYGSYRTLHKNYFLGVVAPALILPTSRTEICIIPSKFPKIYYYPLPKTGYCGIFLSRYKLLRKVNGNCIKRCHLYLFTNLLEVQCSHHLLSEI